jgi:hypothetical protein
MEFDRDKLPASIEVAEKAIHLRLRGLPIANSTAHRKLREARNSLAVLKVTARAHRASRESRVGNFTGSISNTLSTEPVGLSDVLLA